MGSSLTKRRKRGNTTRTTTSSNKGIKTTLSVGNTVKQGGGSHRITSTYKSGGDAYRTETHRTASGYTKRVTKMGEHKKPGRKKVFKGSPTKRVSDRRRKGSYSDAQLLWLAIFLGIFVLFAG
jgi:hypothetical protein